MTNNGPIPRRGNGSNNQQPTRPKPSVWFGSYQPQPDKTASFVEYLRWMRSPNTEAKDGSKVELLQKAEENADYRERLKLLVKRTRDLAGEGNTFRVTCSWRIRVGGIRGPESILLPAFDNLGMPYIPSSTLRGVARSQAIREIMVRDQITWEEAEKKIALYFGDLDVAKEHRTGKVIFFDAYPLPKNDEKAGGLSVDMANNIWEWNADEPNYNPNPNPFLSLKSPTFMIGLRPMPGCDEVTFNKLREWLIKGLTRNGAGSQINSGYGNFIFSSKPTKISREFFRVQFTLAGQLIHGSQESTNNSWRWNYNNTTRQREWQHRGQAKAEVRPIAFKSMLRYWFRTFALGVISPEQIEQLKEWENSIFGGINPRKLGWISCDILNGKVIHLEPAPNEQGRNKPCGEQEGILVLSHNRETPEDKKEAITKLLKNLTWMMFHLGGVGQGARRPCYSRKSRNQAPWFRGSTLTPDPDGEDEFWNLPNSLKQFQHLFRQHLAEFYQAFNELFYTAINPYNPQITNVTDVTSNHWIDAVDANCKIVVCKGREDKGKVYALAVLHNSELKLDGDYDKNLCGGINPAQPSPVWLKDIDYGEDIAYQVVTVFGLNQDAQDSQNPRNRYLTQLQQAGEKSYFQIFPFTET
jgi:CRISPR-associated protein Cmr6